MRVTGPFQLQTGATSVAGHKLRPISKRDIEISVPDRKEFSIKIGHDNDNRTRSQNDDPGVRINPGADFSVPQYI
jgi:hypothetical protein